MTLHGSDGDLLNLKTFYDAYLKTSVAFSPFPALTLMKLSGSDAVDWLQGQVTQDIRSLAQGQVAEYGMCSPTGQLVAEGSLALDFGFIWLTAESRRIDAIRARVSQFVVSEDVELEVFEGWAAVATLGVAAAEAGLSHLQVSDSFVTFPMKLSIEGGTVTFSPHLQTDKILFESEKFAKLLRIEAGRPAFGVEWDEKTLPPEMGDSFTSARVSYSKGCYTGQEIMARIHSRGHTNRRLVGLQSNEPLIEGSHILALGQPVGSITSSCESPRFGWIGLTVLRNSALEESTIVVEAPDGSTTTAQIIPDFEWRGR